MYTQQRLRRGLALRSNRCARGCLAAASQQHGSTMKSKKWGGEVGSDPAANKNGRKKARTKIVRAVYIHKIYNDLESGDAVQPVIDAGADAKEGYAQRTDGKRNLGAGSGLEVG